jgi:phage shock protein C
VVIGLVRLPKLGMIAGVCAGIAEFTDLDVTLLRIVALLAALATGGATVFVYGILWALTPRD